MWSRFDIEKEVACSVTESGTVQFESVADDSLWLRYEMVK